MRQGSLKLYPHPPEKRLHPPLTVVTVSVSQVRGRSLGLARTLHFPASLQAGMLLHLCCLIPSPLLRHGESSQAAPCPCKAASVVVSHTETASAAAFLEKLPLLPASLFAEDPVCGELFEPEKTSCRPPAPSHFVLPAGPFSHSNDFSSWACLLRVLGAHLSVFTLSGRYFYPNS